MIKKLLFTPSVIILFGSVAYSQSTIKGSVKNAKGVPNSGVMVVLKSEDRVVNGAYTDDKGNTKFLVFQQELMTLLPEVPVYVLLPKNKVEFQLEVQKQNLLTSHWIVLPQFLKR